MSHKGKGKQRKQKNPEPHKGKGIKGETNKENCEELKLLKDTRFRMRNGF